MSQAPPYAPSADFSDYQQANPSAPFSGNLLDVETANIAVTTGALSNNAALIQRDDGLLKNNSVHLDSLDTAVKLLIGSLGWIPRGAWVTATTYTAKDLVSFGGIPYVAVTTHVAGAFAADLASGKWLALDSTPPLSSVSSKSAGFNLVAADRQTLFLCTGTFTVTADAAATLGVGWETQFRNTGVGVITIDPNASEQVDSTTTVRLFPGDACFLECTGTAFITHGVSRSSRGFVSISSNTTLLLADYGQTILLSNTFTLALETAAVLLGGWYVDLLNGGTGYVTIDPASTESINGQQTISLSPGESCRLYCSDSITFQAFYRTFTGARSVIGLVSSNDAGTPNTLWNIAFDSIVMRHTGSQGSFRYGAASLANNVAAAGPTANGRDQAGAFSASSWIHFYVIWGAGALSTVSSAVAPPTGPTLPTGYTHWEYVGAVRFNGSSQLVRTRILGDTAFYDAPVTLPGSPFTATTETAISTAAQVPPNATSFLLALFFANGVSDAGGILVMSATIRVVTGTIYATIAGFNMGALPVSTNTRMATGTERVVPNVGQNIFYDWDVTNGSSPSMQLDVTAYKLPILAA
jgi:hypothetical protein